MPREHQEKNMVELKLTISVDEEKRFQNLIKQYKFPNQRLAFANMLLALEEQAGGVEGNKKEEPESPVAVKEDDAKKGKGRKGKKAADDAITDGDTKNAGKNGHSADALEDKDAAMEDDGKKGKGRGQVRVKKDTKGKAQAAAAAESDGHTGEDEEAANLQKAVGKKLMSPKKAPVGRKGREDAKVEPVTTEAELKQEAPKKAAKGKKDAGAIAEEPENGGSDGDIVGLQNGKSPKAAGDGAPQAKKARGKAAKDADHEPAASTKRELKKQSSATAVVEPQDDNLDEPVDNGETRKAGKRKPANTKGLDSEGAAAGTEQGESAGAATKPKRNRAAKGKVNYAEADTSA